MIQVSQRLAIQRHLAKGLSLTPLQAFTKFGSLSLSQRIGEIKRDGFHVEREMVCVGTKRVASYRFVRGKLS